MLHFPAKTAKLETRTRIPTRNSKHETRNLSFLWSVFLSLPPKNDPYFVLMGDSITDFRTARPDLTMQLFNDPTGKPRLGRHLGSIQKPRNRNTTLLGTDPFTTPLRPPLWAKPAVLEQSMYGGKSVNIDNACRGQFLKSHPQGVVHSNGNRLRSCQNDSRSLR